MDRIDFEEWALKTLDPTIAPAPWRRKELKQEEQDSTLGDSKDPKEKATRAAHLADVSAFELFIFSE
jgi:hypothetical protein